MKHSTLHSRLTATVVATLLLSVSDASLAWTSTGWRTILDMGCHTVDNTCYATISGAAVGPVQCPSTSVRWNLEQTPNGKALFAHLTTALLTGRQVSIVIADECYGGTYPTPVYYSIGG